MERAVLAVADVEAEHLTAPVRGHTGRDHHGLGHDPVVNAGLAVGRIQEDVAKRLLTQRSVAERGDLDVELGADPRDFGLGDAGVAPNALIRSSTLRVLAPCRYASMITANSD